MFMQRGIGLNNPAVIMVVFLILGPVLIVWGIAGYFISGQTTNKCTAVTHGVVTAVEMEKRINYRNVETGYTATIEPEESGIFSTSYLSSGRVGYEYKEGQHVQINYDPSDPSNYYIQHASPTSGNINLIIIGAIVLFMGTGICIVRKIGKSFP